MSRALPLRRRSAAKKAAPKRNGRIELGALGDVIAFNLRIAQDASFRVFAKNTGEPQLKPGRFAAMMVIHNNPGLTQADLGRAIARDKSSVTPLVKELHREGLVMRRSSGTDRRSTTLTLSKSGEAALAALLACAMEHDRKLDAIVGDRKAEFVTLLKKIADELR